MMWIPQSAVMGRDRMSGRPTRGWLRRRHECGGGSSSAGTGRPSCGRVRQAEKLGFDSVWFPDHPAEFAWDAWTRMAAAAMATERVRLGTIVSCVFYRHPVLLARQVADADQVSSGRVLLRLDIGDWPVAFARLGLPYP